METWKRHHALTAYVALSAGSCVEPLRLFRLLRLDLPWYARGMTGHSIGGRMGTYLLVLLLPLLVIAWLLGRYSWRAAILEYEAELEPLLGVVPPGGNRVS